MKDSNKIQELLIKTCELNEISTQQALCAMSLLITTILMDSGEKYFEEWLSMVIEQRDKLKQPPPL